MFAPVNQKHLPRLNDDEVERYARSTQMGVYDLITSERVWRDCQPHLQRHGYLLRPRYSPGWKPSWLGTNLDPTFCEDSITSNEDIVLDARRRKDDALVAIKIVEKNKEEIQISQFLASLPGIQNHCVPIYDVLPDPFDSERSFIVMPYLRPFDDPPFYMAGEVIDFVDQTLEGLAFLHRNRVAHRDVSSPNIMMDARPLYPDGHHPVRRNYTPDGVHRITGLTRTEHPVRYFFIDFGLSTRFPPGSSSLVVGDIGRDTEVPELSSDVPYDAYKVDVFSLGNIYYKEFEQKYHDMEFLGSLVAEMKRADPSTRPSVQDAIARWQQLKSDMNPATYRWRLSAKSEQPIERAINDTVAAAWKGFTSLKKMVA